MPKIVSKRIVKPALDPVFAGDLFDKVEGFAGYGFNKSHSCEYTLISYQCMWLKVHYPVEFFAAALTILDEEKKTTLLKDAKLYGITVETPTINISTNRFEIITDTRLAMPLQVVLGISEKSATAIMEARVKAGGKFTDKAHFLANVEKRKCNSRVQDILDRIGSFAWIEPGQKRPDDPSRIRDQIELIPGLISATVPIDRVMWNTKGTRQMINDMVADAREKMADIDGESLPIKPYYGKDARVMIITDAVGTQEDYTGVMGAGQTAVLQAMDSVGMEINQVYWTALIKRPKKNKTITPAEIERYAPFLEEEIRILEPDVIVALGTSTVRYLIPDFNGKAADAAGNIVYLKDRDVNLVVGFNPGEIYFTPEKQGAMDLVFASVEQLI